MNTDISPVLITAGASVFVGLLVFVATIYNRKRGAVDARLPSVDQIWKQNTILETEKGLIQTALNGCRDLWMRYARRVQNGGDTDFTRDERAALDLPPLTDEGEPA